MLQVLEDGRLTDSQGRTVDFRNTVIVMTSNLGSDHIQEMNTANKPQNEIYDKVLSVVGQHFRPEFVNRIDEVVVFEPLSREQIRGIADIQLNLLRQRLVNNKNCIMITNHNLKELESALGPYCFESIKHTV